MDQTSQINQIKQHYGSSDCTNPAFLSPGVNLNYANGASIQKPIEQLATVIPQIQHWKDEVGLFGAENIFIRYYVDVDKDGVTLCIPEPGWLCAAYIDIAENDPEYAGVLESEEILPDTDPYKHAVFAIDLLPEYDEQAFIKIELVNRGTGNKHHDVWLDARLYTKDRMEHPSDTLWIPNKEYFYVGFHARNTRRTPYDIALKIGFGYQPLEYIENKEDVQRTIAYGNKD